MPRLARFRRRSMKPSPASLFSRLHQAPTTGSSTLAPHRTWLANSSMLSSTAPSSSHIIVGNGATLPLQCADTAIVPTSSSPLFLRDVLVAPSLIQNLISVRRLTRDNSVAIEFDPLAFPSRICTTGRFSCAPPACPQHLQDFMSPSISGMCGWVIQDSRLFPVF